MYSTADRILHFSYFETEYPTSGLDVTGLARVYIPHKFSCCILLRARNMEIKKRHDMRTQHVLKQMSRVSGNLKRRNSTSGSHIISPFSTARTNEGLPLVPSDYQRAVAPSSGGSGFYVALETHWPLTYCDLTKPSNTESTLKTSDYERKSMQRPYIPQPGRTRRLLVSHANPVVAPLFGN